MRKFFAAISLFYLAFATYWVARSGCIQINSRELLNVSTDSTKHFYDEINAAFLAKHGEDIDFVRQSHGGSASQARLINEGLDADICTLGLWNDTDSLRKNGLIPESWEDRYTNRSLPFESTIVFVVRTGNVKKIYDWNDLLREDVSIITPNPKTSGNGKWSFLAIWGALKKQKHSDAEIEKQLASIFHRVPILDAGARAATLTFAQKNFGDVHLTWENEAFYEIEEAKGTLEIVYPKSGSIRAEPHVAVVDQVVKRKKTEALANAYIQFLYSDKGQEIAAKHHFRPTVNFTAHTHKFQAIELFSIRDLGLTWPEIQLQFFAEDGLFDRVLLLSSKLNSSPDSAKSSGGLPK